MSTEIKPGNLLLNIGSHPGKALREAVAGASRGGQDKPAPLDSVSVTAEASRLLAMEDRLAAMPDVDHERVAAIKQAIADGTYQIDPQRIAEKLIQFEADQGKSSDE